MKDELQEALEAEESEREIARENARLRERQAWERVERDVLDVDADEPTCPRCGSTRFVYQGDVQRCAECGR